jgi:uracil phosphoribosyltransferase
MKKLRWESVFLPNHSYIEHKLSMMRDKNTPKKIFKELVEEISIMLTYEATKDFPLETTEIETPLIKTDCRIIKGRKPAVIPILRAGLGMVEGVLKIIPQAKVGHIGLYRKPDTLEPIEYYAKFPTHLEEREVFIVDPMLATGGSVEYAINSIKKAGAKKIKFLCIISCPEGIERIRKVHPDVRIYTASVDEKLNDHAYILPGLGDAGDRLFGTL